MRADKDEKRIVRRDSVVSVTRNRSGNRNVAFRRLERTRSRALDAIHMTNSERFVARSMPFTDAN